MRGVKCGHTNEQDFQVADLGDNPCRNWCFPDFGRASTVCRHRCAANMFPTRDAIRMVGFVEEKAQRDEACRASKLLVNILSTARSMSPSPNGEDNDEPGGRMLTVVVHPLSTVLRRNSAAAELFGQFR